MGGAVLKPALRGFPIAWAASVHARTCSGLLSGGCVSAGGEGGSAACPGPQRCCRRPKLLWLGLGASPRLLGTRSTKNREVLVE